MVFLLEITCFGAWNDKFKGHVTDLKHACLTITVHVHTFYSFITTGTVLATCCANLKEFDLLVCEIRQFYSKLVVSDLKW